tara:strand:+ start:324 stop:1412 length:1089 start_codon:yes stop_codon:yes gene_type:complete
MSKAAELANLIGNINAGGGGANRNAIINGAMNVSARGTSFASVSTGTYTLDRFKRDFSHDGNVTITQDSSAPEGFANSLKVDVTTADTSLAAGQYENIAHIIEAQNLQNLAFGTSDAKNITVSFYVKSNKTGTYAFNISQSDNSSKQATLNYTINSANTWERKSLTFTGDTSGVINDDNGRGLHLVWFLAAGSTYNSGSASATFQTYDNADYAAGQAVNVLDSTDNTWFLTGCQLEVGQNATEFEHINNFGEELAKCERYFAVYGENTANGHVASGYYHSTTQLRCHMPYRQKMRAAPTGTINNVGSFFVQDGGATQGPSAITIDENIDTALLIVTTSSRTAGNGGALLSGTNSSIFMEAEL